MLSLLAVLAIVQGILLLIDGMRNARHMRTFRPRRGNREPVLVFCPCKGTDPEFESNIRSILEQDYPNHETVFIVETEDDPAYKVLREMEAGNIVVAGRAMDCGQKVHNLAYAVRHVQSSAQIYVFCDSDARFPRDWLSKMIAALDSSNITTGYRWYVAGRAHLPTRMRSAWNASSLGGLGGHKRNFAWGGSTAIYRETFQRLNILDAWRGAVSDDFPITNAAQRAGAQVIFVPECLIPSYGECTWGEMLEFTTRQMTLMRVYHARLWRITFAGNVIFNAAFLILPWTHPLLWLVVYALSILRIWIRYRAVATVVPPGVLSDYRWFYILSTPLVAFLFLCNMTLSMRKDIVWRKRHYRLLSPHETRVFID
jgi:cellulose synthase/poly-beta-1,6-N-acetylglucosamine synthase-like glycosyltransferase